MDGIDRDDSSLRERPQGRDHDIPDRCKGNRGIQLFGRLLIERARKMYSASLERTSLDAVRFGAPIALKNVLDRVSRAWDTLLEGQPQEYSA